MEQLIKTIASEARKYFRQTEDIEDITQDVLIKLLVNQGRYRMSNALARTITRNHALNQLKKHKASPVTHATIHDHYHYHYLTCTMDNYISARREIDRYTDKLPSKQSRVAKMLLDGYSYDEISNSFDKPTSYNAIKCLVRDMRKNLKKFGILD